MLKEFEWDTICTKECERENQLMLSTEFLINNNTWAASVP